MDASAALLQLARHYEVDPEYEDFSGRRQVASPEVLSAILEGLGVPAEDPASALRDAMWQRWSELIEPVTVAWDGTGRLVLRLPAAAADARAHLEVTSEQGAIARAEIELADAPVVERTEIEGTSFEARSVPLPLDLATGYHTVRVTVREDGHARDESAVLLVAPRRVFELPPPVRRFGVFAPVYSLYSANSLGAGDLGDLRRLVEWAGAQGGHAVATLPLLSAFLDEPIEISPYVPVSRLAWNELYLELSAIPEWSSSSAARAALATPTARTALDRARNAEFVDPPTVMGLKRPALEAMARQLYDDGGARRSALESFAAERPEVIDYCRFRAAAERMRIPWQRWPARQRGGSLRAGDFDADVFRYHLFVQFSMHEQLSALASRAGSGGPGLHLDLPLGVHRSGFDSWREQGLFAHALRVGAPPDALFAGGQDWTFPPSHPFQARRDGYRGFIAAVRNQLRYAQVLRIDHVMGLHRLYVLPPGASPRQGAYLRYRADELWAILSIESHRSRALLVGEDLGTVPAEVRSAMQAHGVSRTYVLQHAARPDPESALPPAPRLAVASLNTHDMPTFAAWLSAQDIERQRSFGWITDDEAEGERAAREQLVAALRAFLRPSSPESEVADRGLLLRESLRHLGAGDAWLAIVALDDLLGSVAGHNIPGTTKEHPNWRRRLPVTLEELNTLAEVSDALSVLREAREESERRAIGETLNRGADPSRSLPGDR